MKIKIMKWCTTWNMYLTEQLWWALTEMCSANSRWQQQFKYCFCLNLKPMCDAHPCFRMNGSFQVTIICFCHGWLQFLKMHYHGLCHSGELHLLCCSLFLQLPKFCSLHVADHEKFLISLMQFSRNISCENLQCFSNPLFLQQMNLKKLQHTCTTFWDMFCCQSYWEKCWDHDHRRRQGAVRSLMQLPNPFSVQFTFVPWFHQCFFKIFHEKALCLLATNTKEKNWSSSTNIVTNHFRHLYNALDASSCGWVLLAVLPSICSSDIIWILQSDLQWASAFNTHAALFHSIKESAQGGWNLNLNWGVDFNKSRRNSSWYICSNN